MCLLGLVSGLVPDASTDVQIYLFISCANTPPPGGIKVSASVMEIFETSAMTAKSDKIDLCLAYKQ